MLFYLDFSFEAIAEQFIDVVVVAPFFFSIGKFRELKLPKLLIRGFDG